jgi:hypothetical protein
MLLRELFHDIEVDDQQPLKKGDTVRVFHGFNNYNDAILAVKYGLSGAQKVPRVYSYESDNNPKGLFVTGKFKTAASFAGSYKYGVIIEFTADYSELEAPVWPGGSWTGYGGYSQYFGWGPEGRRGRAKARKDAEDNARSDKYNPEWVTLSDNPHLADMMLNKGETQALFIGHLNPNRITTVYVKVYENHIANGDWIKLSSNEFLEKYGNDIDPKHKNENRDKVFAPDEDFNPELFKERLGAKYNKTLNFDDVFGRMWKHIKTDKHKQMMFNQYFDMYVWPKQKPGLFNWLKRTYK